MRDLNLTFQVRSVGDDLQVANCWRWLNSRSKCELDALHDLLLEEKTRFETTEMDYYEAGVDCVAWMADHGGGVRVWEVLYPKARRA